VKRVSWGKNLASTKPIYRGKRLRGKSKIKAVWNSGGRLEGHSGQNNGTKKWKAAQNVTKEKAEGGAKSAACENSLSPTKRLNKKWEVEEGCCSVNARASVLEASRMLKKWERTQGSWGAGGGTND